MRAIYKLFIFVYFTAQATFSFGEAPKSGLVKNVPPSFLTAKDLGKARHFLNKSQFPEPGMHAPFWVCVNSRRDQVSVRCDDLGINPGEGRKADLQIFLSTPDYFHEYGLRHGILYSECHKYRRAIENMSQKLSDML